ncbi:MAG TPA: FeoA family protein [Acidobacteriaceae bacterium]
MTRASKSSAAALLPLHKLAQDASAVLIRIDLGAEETDHLGLMGFFPGVGVTASGKAPGGDPRIYRIDQSEIALRNETARNILVRLDEVEPAVKAGKP